MSRRTPREVPLRFDDDFRFGVASVVTLPILLVPLVLGWVTIGMSDGPLILAAACLALCGSSLLFLIWTHVLFAATAPGELARVGAAQYWRGTGIVSRLLGVGGTTNMAVTAAGTALIVAVAAAIFGRDTGGVWLPILVLATVASSWATMVYAFALRYFRLNCGGERIDFDIEEDPRFADFLTMAVMVSAVAAMSAGTPRTRRSLSSVRTHTLIAFSFNALIVAMTVSILGGFIGAASA